MKNLNFKIALSLVLMLFLATFTQNAFAQAEEMFLKSLRGNWDFDKVEIASGNKANATKTAQVKADLVAKYGSTALLFSKTGEKTFKYEGKGGSKKGTFEMVDEEDLVLTLQDGSVLLKGKLYFFDYDKKMGLMFTVDGVKVSLVYVNYAKK